MWFKIYYIIYKNKLNNKLSCLDVIKILLKKSNILNNKNYNFIPACPKVLTHVTLEILLFEINKKCVVIVINGKIKVFIGIDNNK